MNVQLRTLMPLLETACQRADEIVRVACRISVDLPELKRLQREQRVDQERLLRIGLNTEALAPLAAAFGRHMRNDNVIGLDRLAKHQAAAYHTWLRRLGEVDRCLVGLYPGDQRSIPGGHRANLIALGRERQAA